MADFTEVSCVISWNVVFSLNHNWSINGLTETAKLESPFRSFSPLFVESRPWPRTTFSRTRTTGTNTPITWANSSVSSKDSHIIDKIAFFLAKRELYGRG
uniref:Uncharacterized protein n=1 Tax=Romanomermis culicivorax TaxID=13658 RepID=A0A915I1Z0_ROMCU